MSISEPINLTPTEQLLFDSLKKQEARLNEFEGWLKTLAEQFAEQSKADSESGQKIASALQEELNRLDATIETLRAVSISTQEEQQKLTEKLKVLKLLIQQLDEFSRMQSERVQRLTVQLDTLMKMADSNELQP
jgi:septal ring factor EnvC (AmiA/AmiB activator)